MNSRGLITVIVILVLAVSAATVSWWFRYSQTKQCLAYWGPDDARRIGAATEIELFHLGSLVIESSETEPDDEDAAESDSVAEANTDETPSTENESKVEASGGESAEVSVAKESTIPPEEKLIIDQTEYQLVRLLDAAKLRGVSHFRHIMTQDSSFNWDSLKHEYENVTWELVLRFKDRRGYTDVAFDFDERVLKRLPDGKPLSFDPASFGIGQFLEGEVTNYLERSKP